MRGLAGCRRGGVGGGLGGAGGRFTIWTFTEGDSFRDGEVLVNRRKKQQRLTAKSGMAIANTVRACNQGLGIPRWKSATSVMFHGDEKMLDAGLSRRQHGVDNHSMRGRAVGCYGDFARRDRQLRAQNTRQALQGYRHLFDE